MNKKVKFRAWDKKLHVMWEPIEFNKLLKYLIFQSCPNATAYEAIKDHFEDIIWEQSTGLFDKNDTEIFEGDVVSAEGAFILWDRQLACWCFNFKNSETPNIPLFYDKIENFEVLGHIHK